MLISKFVKVKWSSYNKKYFIEHGYNFTKCGDEFEVKVEDLRQNSDICVICKCDYCGEEYTEKWCKYLRKRNQSPVKKDNCSKCSHKKRQETFFLNHGVKSIWETEGFRDKIKKIMIEKYGSENPFGSEIIKEKIKNTNLEKYGVTRATKLPEVIEKSRQTCMEKYGVSNYSQTEEFRKGFSGENSPVWKGDNTIHGREERFDPQYYQWRKEIFKRDNYTCQCCGAKNKKGNHKSIQLHAHHIKNWSDNPDDRFDINNGITLCSECHYSFHSEYGKHNNTQEQLDEFINNKLNNEDKNICWTSEN